jgi:putative endonuclease
MHERTLAGLAAEGAVAEELERRGYRVVDRNFRRRCGELDIVARSRDEVVFVEVRSRAGPGLEAEAAESVQRGKVARVKATAQRWLDARPIDYAEVRFFLVLVCGAGDSGRQVWLEDAF